MTLKVIGSQTLISIDFYDFFSSVSSLVLVSIEKIYRTLKTVFDSIYKQRIRQKFSVARRIFNSDLLLVFEKLVKSGLSCLMYFVTFAQQVRSSCEILWSKIPQPWGLQQRNVRNGLFVGKF